MTKDDNRYLILESEAEDMDSYLSSISFGLKNSEFICSRAIKTLFSVFACDYSSVKEIDFFENKRSPIEQIFFISYITLAEKRNRLIKWHSQKENKDFSKIPMNNELLNIFPQEEVYVGDKKYVVDFIIDFHPVSDNTGTLYAVELDGYDFHSSKKQMNHDYERERALQKAGYKVVRFTGSQVYKTPFSCAKELIELIINDSLEFIEFDDLGE